MCLEYWRKYAIVVLRNFILTLEIPLHCNCGYFDIHEQLSSVEHEKSFISLGPDHGFKSQAKTGAANRSNQ